ncbi:fidgetin-like isoform X1 [Entelurus aequoreus]|uniref:fidgetin-like isoform X1 n=2 Tax=Entelurus aequoreus TaxID=161455 RepID=UPI002B1D14B0|nr:fidgetin-like isoform X1 [Entelurus aequoreus]
MVGLKMQWHHEQSQWAEQHFDISSTTRSPGHKAEAYHLVPGIVHCAATDQYAWANDDISALTASNLLKKYAEKYSSILAVPVSCSEAPSDPVGINGRKGESDPWQDGVYSMSCIPDGVTIRKGGVAATSEVVTGLCSSPGIASSTLSEQNYSRSSCGNHITTALHSASLPSQEYSVPYSGTYLHSSYNSQSVPPPAHPSPLHSSGILQPPPPSCHPTLVPPHKGGAPDLSGYNYSAAGYPVQSSVRPGYSPRGVPLSNSYIPSGIATPTPLPPSSTLPGYPYHNHSLTPITPSHLNSCSSNTLKRTAFYITGQGDNETPYPNFGFDQTLSSADSMMYRVADSSSTNGSSNGTSGIGFDRNSEKSLHHFSLQKQYTKPSEQQQKKYNNQESSIQLSPSPCISSTLRGSRSADSLFCFISSQRSEQSAEDHHFHLSHSGAPSSSSTTCCTLSALEQLKTSDPHLLDMVTSEIVQHGPSVDWSDIAGLELAKVTLKEEVLWPILRPDIFTSLGTTPNCVLLFGPRGCGRTLLGQCLASQLGKPLLLLSGSTLVTKWLTDGERIIRASFLVAHCRQPCVLFISEVDMLLASQLADKSPINRLKRELLSQLDSLLMGSGEDGSNQVLVVCSTSRPQEMDEGLHRYFALRVLVPLPDSAARHQIIRQLLTQSQQKYCMSEEDLALLVQRTGGFSGFDLGRLCHEAQVGLSHVSTQQGIDINMMPRGENRPMAYLDFESVFCKLHASTSAKEIDMYTEWNKIFGSSPKKDRLS